MAADELFYFDAGDMGCGELIMKLKFQFQHIPEHGRLVLTALDAGAIEDIPAWCRLTGHQLVEALHPRYVIKKRVTS